MRYNEILKEAIGPVKSISKQEAIDKKMFGPVYHGTNKNIDDILQSGFNVKHSIPQTIDQRGRPVESSNGMSFAPYTAGGNIPAPIHWLGWGVYFSLVKSIATQYNGGTTKGLKEFYLDVHNVETINFGSPNTMMAWWKKNGYDPSPDLLKNNDIKGWIKATGNLTRALRQQFDAVYYRGKGIHRLLDGSQICVYDSSKIYVIDQKLSKSGDVGSKVTHNQKELRQRWVELGTKIEQLYANSEVSSKQYPGFRAYVNQNGSPINIIPPPNVKGVITNIRQANPQFADGRDKTFEIKWAKGGTGSYYEDELNFI